MSTTVEERLDTLEAILGRYIVHTDTSLNRLTRGLEEFKDEMKAFKSEMLEFKDEMKAFKDEMLEFKDEMKAFKDEMRDFKDEMKVFKDEMLEFKDEMKAFKDEMLEFKDEIKVFKDEMLEFKDEMRSFKTDTNKKWGELANKFGTLLEDLVEPAFPPLVARCFEEELEGKAVRIRRRVEGTEGEFDLVAHTATRVFLVEVKSSITQQVVDAFLATSVPRFRELFPEYQGKPLYPILASLRVDPSVVDYCTASRVYVMTYREWDYMDLVNLEEVNQVV